jgi:hypothetical protein
MADIYFIILLSYFLIQNAPSHYRIYKIVISERCIHLVVILSKLIRIIG